MIFFCLSGKYIQYNCSKLLTAYLKAIHELQGWLCDREELFWHLGGVGYGAVKVNSV